jgi:hypothetical protein
MKKEEDQVDILTFRVPHKAIPRDVDVSAYFVSIGDIEHETEPDFLHELSDDLENILEINVWDIWTNLPN